MDFPFEFIFKGFPRVDLKKVIMHYLQEYSTVVVFTAYYLVTKSTNLDIKVRVNGALLRAEKIMLISFLNFKKGYNPNNNKNKK